MRTCADLCDSSYQSAQSHKMKQKAGEFIAFSTTACFGLALWVAFSLADAVRHWQDHGDFPFVLFHSFSWHLSLSVLLLFHLFKENDRCPWVRVRTGLLEDGVPFHKVTRQIIGHLDTLQKRILLLVLRSLAFFGIFINNICVCATHFAQKQKFLIWFVF